MAARAIAALLASCAILAVAATGASGDANSDAVNAVVGFDPANLDTQERLEEVLDAAAARAGVLRPHLASGNLNRRWAAAYLAHNLARFRPDFQMLERRRRDRDPSVRAMVNFGLLGGGRKASIPILIELLASSREMLNSDPPMPLAVLADRRLRRYTGANFGFNFRASSRSRRRAVAKWWQWWREVRGNIRWSPGSQRYRWRRQRAGSRAAARAASPSARAPRATASRPVAVASQNTSGAVANEKLTIEVNIELIYDSGVTSRQRSIMESAIRRAQNVLNGRGRTGQCLDMDFKINIHVRRAGDSARPGFHQVKVNQTPVLRNPNNSKAGYRRSFVFTPKPNEQGSARFFPPDFEASGSAVAAHEILHLMSLGDAYTRNGDGSVTHHDRENMLDDLQGNLLQSSLDELANRFAKEDERKCERYKLTFTPWRTELTAHSTGSGSNRQHFIGELATANVSTGFWANPRNNRITPAGEAAGGDSEMIPPVRATEGNANCTPNPSFTPARVRFHAVAGGERQGDQLRIKLRVGDEERFSYSCTPPARPPAGVKNLISDGMEALGALDFTIPRPALGGTRERQFQANPAPKTSASGKAVLTRLN